MNEDIKTHFEVLQSDFFHYMITFGNMTPKASRDYISRLRFLANTYIIDDSITIEKIELILLEEDKKRLERETHNTKKSIGDFKSGLRKFYEFIKSDYNKKYEDSILSEINKIQSSRQIKDTEKNTIIKSRIGQGEFREKLIKYWKGCSVTGFGLNNLLVASHIKPWKDSSNQQRIDVYNGLLLLPNLDKLFDRGYITFRQNGKIIISNTLSNNDRVFLGLHEGIALIRLEEEHKPYLKYHYDNCYIG